MQWHSYKLMVRGKAQSKTIFLGGGAAETQALQKLSKQLFLMLETPYYIADNIQREWMVQYLTHIKKSQVT